MSPIQNFKKLCDYCNTWLPYSCFYKSKNKLDGIQGKCIDCIKDYKLKRKIGIKQKAEKIRKEFYYVPDIYIVGFGHTQTYQSACISCEKAFFSFIEYKEYEDLFCENCKVKEILLPERNKCTTNYIGNVVGWLQKCVSEQQKRPRRNYKKVYERDRYTCQYCGFNLENAKKFLPLHIDHIKPWGAKGGNAITNLIVACRECNLIAADKWFTGFEEKKEFILNQRIKKGYETYDRDFKLQTS